MLACVAVALQQRLRQAGDRIALSWFRRGLGVIAGDQLGAPPAGGPCAIEGGAVADRAPVARVQGAEPVNVEDAQRERCRGAGTA